jgi:hypothetical protein
MTGTLRSIVIDCPDPGSLAAFYEQLLGVRRFYEDPDWVSIGDPADRPALAFQRVDDYRAPEWPGQLVPQQFHLDVEVSDLDAGEREVLALGATSAHYGEEGFRVYFDPIGHPFCLVAEA